MPQAPIAALVIGLPYAGFVLFADRLPPQYQAGVFWVLPFIGFAAVAWAFVPQRNRKG
jgi:hypothetical protein